MSSVLSFYHRDSSHNGLNATRCLCVVFINASTSTVQFLEMRYDGWCFEYEIQACLHDDLICCWHPEVHFSSCHKPPLSSKTPTLLAPLGSAFEMGFPAGGEPHPSALLLHLPLSRSQVWTLSPVLPCVRVCVLTTLAAPTQYLQRCDHEPVLTSRLAVESHTVHLIVRYHWPGGFLLCPTPLCCCALKIYPCGR